MSVFVFPRCSAPKVEKQHVVQRTVRDRGKGLREVVRGRDGASLAGRDRKTLEDNRLALGLGLLLGRGVRLDAVQEV